MLVTVWHNSASQKLNLAKDDMALPAWELCIPDHWIKKQWSIYNNGLINIQLYLKFLKQLTLWCHVASVTPTTTLVTYPVVHKLCSSLLLRFISITKLGCQMLRLIPLLRTSHCICNLVYHSHLLVTSTVAAPIYHLSGLILGLHPANERRRYFVTTSLICWAQTWNQPWFIKFLNTEWMHVP